VEEKKKKKKIIIIITLQQKRIKIPHIGVSHRTSKNEIQSMFIERWRDGGDK